MLRPADKLLLDHLATLRNRERSLCVAILLDLVRVERRKLHVSLGYSSLFAFATRHLRYSESAAGRRVQAARLIRDHPEVIPLLRRGAVNLSTISLLSRVLNPMNKKALLARIAGKSQRQVEVIVAEYQPPRRVRDRIQPVNAPRAHRNGATAGTPVGGLGLEVPALHAMTVPNHSRNVSERETDTSIVREGDAVRDGRHAVTAAGTTDVGDASDDRRGVGSSSSNVERQFKVQFAAGAEFLRKFEEAQALLSTRFPKGTSIESVLEACMDAFLDRNSPARRSERRRARDAKRAVRKTQQTSTENGNRAGDRAVDHAADRAAEQRVRHAARESTAPPGDRSLPQRERVAKRRAVPAALSDAVFERDGGCCMFIGVDGRRCGSRHDVEIDHCQPVARGGTNTMDNLRLLCAVHNRLEAERVFGAAWMQRFARS